MSSVSFPRIPTIQRFPSCSLEAKHAKGDYPTKNKQHSPVTTGTLVFLTVKFPTLNEKPDVLIGEL